MELAKTNTEELHLYSDSFNAVANRIILDCIYEMSIYERRIIGIALSKVKCSSEVKGTEWWSCSVKEYAALCKVGEKKTYDLFEEVSRKLYNRTIVMPGLSKGKSIMEFRWIQAIEFNKTTKTIYLQWSNQILPFITNLGENEPFTRVFLDDLLKLKSIYSIKLYELLRCSASSRNKVSKVFEVKWLMSYLNVPDSCTDFRYFNNKILKHVCAELLEHQITDLKIEAYEKEGKRVKSLRFSWEISQRRAKPKEKLHEEEHSIAE